MRPSLMFFYSFLMIIPLWAKGQRVLDFLHPEVKFCGHNISWQALIAGLSSKEADCLDSLGPVRFEETASSSQHPTSGRELSRDQIVGQLRSMKAECLNEVELKIPARLNLRNENWLGQDALNPWIIEQLIQTTSIKNVEIVKLQIPRIDCGKVNQMRFGSFRVEGKNFFRLLISADEKNFVVTGEFRLFENLPVARRNLTQGDKINPADFESARKDVTFSPGYVGQIEEIAGRTLLYPVIKGEALQLRQLKAEVSVEKGQIVQIQLKGENFILSSSGVAEQSGAVGDFIKIKNVESQKVISGIILGKGLVEVQ